MKTIDGLDKLLSSLDEPRRSILKELIKIVYEITGLEPELRPFFVGYKTPKNRGFVYINVNSKLMYIGYFAGKMMIDQNPLIVGIFDEILRYNSKQYLREFEDIERKHVKELVEYAWKFHTK